MHPPRRDGDRNTLFDIMSESGLNIYVVGRDQIILKRQDFVLLCACNKILHLLHTERIFQRLNMSESGQLGYIGHSWASLKKGALFICFFHSRRLLQ